MPNYTTNLYVKYIIRVFDTKFIYEYNSDYKSPGVKCQYNKKNMSKTYVYLVSTHKMYFKEHYKRV